MVSLFFVVSGVAVAHTGESHTLRIDRGDSLADIAVKLKADGIIRSTGFFKMYSFITGAAHRFQPGVYTIDGDQGVVSVVRRLTTPPPPVVAVVTEGLTLRDIDAKLHELGVLRSGELVAYATDERRLRELRQRYPFLQGSSSLEGFLFPDTYKFASGSSPEVIVRAMLDEFQARAYPLLSEKKDWYTIVILASLLEKEVSSQADRMVVAGILRRRMALGMPLQVDATITYVKCGGEYVSCRFRGLTRSDFKIESPYNTYLSKGLPPGPIANPGLDAIRAALQPRQSPYLFYLSDPATSRTIFSRDFEEHNRNRARYLRL